MPRQQNTQPSGRSQAHRRSGFARSPPPRASHPGPCSLAMTKATTQLECEPRAGAHAKLALHPGCRGSCRPSRPRKVAHSRLEIALLMPIIVDFDAGRCAPRLPRRVQQDSVVRLGGKRSPVAIRARRQSRRQGRPREYILCAPELARARRAQSSFVRPVGFAALRFFPCLGVSQGDLGGRKMKF